MKLELHLTLKSDATFGRGDGVAGLVDQEVEYDPVTGLPYLRGRSLKGLLVEECSNLLFALSLQASPALQRMEEAARYLFGEPGSTSEEQAAMKVGNALLPMELRKAIEADIKTENPRLDPKEVLESLTAIRRQTSVDETTGAPETGSLRTIRVILRHTTFVAALHLVDHDIDDSLRADVLALLAACVMALRRAGVGRNRGRGRVRTLLCNEAFTKEHFNHFRRLLEGNKP